MIDRCSVAEVADRRVKSTLGSRSGRCGGSELVKDLY